MILNLSILQSEWLKKRRSLASWLVVVGGLFTPLILLAARLKNNSVLGELYGADDFWIRAWHQAWESMAVFLLPIGIVLATGLIAQIEFKNNTWKQVHVTPQRLTSIFVAKYLVILTMLVQVFAIFNIGLYLSVLLPSLIFAQPMPSSPIPASEFLIGNLRFFLACLPIVALQYLLSLQFRNFLVPVGAGLAFWFLGLGLLSWQYSFAFPYNQSTIYFLVSSGQASNRIAPMLDMEVVAAGYFILFTIVGWVLYVTKNEKG